MLDTVSPNMTCREAALRMKELESNVLFCVNESNEITGKVTPRHLIYASWLSETHPSVATLRQAKENSFIAAKKDTPPETLLKIMRDHNIHDVPLVTDDRSSCVDCVSIFTVAEELKERGLDYPNRTLREVWPQLFCRMGPSRLAFEDCVLEDAMAEIYNQNIPAMGIIERKEYHGFKGCLTQQDILQSVVIGNADASELSVLQVPGADKRGLEYLPSTCSVLDAFYIMLKNRYISLPIVKAENQQVYGVIDFIDLASIATAPQITFSQRVLRYTRSLCGLDTEKSRDYSAEFTGRIDDPIPVAEKPQEPIYIKSKAATLLTLNFPELAQAHDYCEASFEAHVAAEGVFAASMKNQPKDFEVETDTVKKMFSPVLERLNSAMELVQRYDTPDAWTLKVRILTGRIGLKEHCLEDTPGAIDDFEQLFQVAETLASKGTFLSPISTCRQENWRLNHFKLLFSQSRYEEAGATLKQHSFVNKQALESQLSIMKAKHAELAADANHEFKLTQYPDAVRYYNTAIRIANVLKSLETQVENNLVLYNNRARCYMKMNMMDLALQDCDMCISTEPTYLKPWTKKLEIYEKLERWNDLVEVYDQACEIVPEAEEQFSKMYARAMEGKAELEREAEAALHRAAIKVRGDSIMAAIEASLKESTTVPNESERHTITGESERDFVDEEGTKIDVEALNQIDQDISEHLRPWLKKLQTAEALEKWNHVIDIYDDVCDQFPEADEKFADFYDRATSLLKSGKKESKQQNQQSFQKRRADYLAAAMQASLKGEELPPELEKVSC